MSADLMVFDPTNSPDVPSDKEALRAYVLDVMRADTSDATSGEAAPTAAIQAAVDELTRLFGTLREPKGERVWTSWPPVVGADGRLLTLGVDFDCVMDVTMILVDVCESRGLVLMDPQGDELFVYLPGGGGVV